MNKVFERLAALTMQRVVILAVVASALYFYMMYDDGSSIEANIGKKNGEVAAEEAKKKDTDAALKQVKEMQQKLGLLSQQYQEISRRLPATLYSIDINKAIDGFARNAGVTVKEKKPGEVVKKEIVEEVPVQVVLDGTYAELAQFTFLVSRAERLTRVKNIVLTLKDKGQVGHLEFVADVVGYRSAPEKKAETKQ
jgi:type IV pilus assembly protein PilO